MRFLSCLVVLFLFLFPFQSLLCGQDSVLRNDDVVKLVQAGLSIELIVTMIQSSPVDFDTKVDSILVLKEQGLDETILAAMIAAMSRKDSPEPTLNRPASDPPSEESESDLPQEVGVYFVDKKTDQFRFMEPEIVTWKTGGFWKSVATVGLNKGHVNGIVKGAVGNYILDGDEEIIIYCMEGTSGTEYQLLGLWEKKDSREFRAVTGGIVHASGGADENAVYFEPTRVSPRIYRFRLPGLAPGEYGLLPPGAQASSSAASIGKIYAFSVGR